MERQLPTWLEPFGLRQGCQPIRDQIQPVGDKARDTGLQCPSALLVYL